MPEPEGPSGSCYGATPLTSAIERAVAAIGPERFLATLTAQEQQALAYQWRLWARPSQLPPAGDWLTWLIMAGRGFGKTRKSYSVDDDFIVPDDYEGLGLKKLEQSRTV